MEAGHADIAIHLISTILSLALLTVSILAWKRDRRNHLAFVCLAFFLSAIQQAILCLSAVRYNDTMTSIAHMMSLGIILSFFFAIRPRP